MESFILAGISLIILLPILYFLPLGFTVKGKVLVVLASFLIGVFGLIAEAVFPLWQTALILLLFVSALAYLLSKRNLEWLYLQEETIDPFAVEEEEETSPVLELKPSYTYIATSEKNPKVKQDENINHYTNGSSPQLGLLERQSSAVQSRVKVDHSSDELEELILDIEKPVEIEPKNDYEPLTAETQSTESLGETINMNAIDDSKLEEVSDPDIEALIQKTEEDAIELESSQTQKDDSHQYISELEQMIETGELDANNSTSMNDVPLPTMDIEDILDQSDEEVNQVQRKEEVTASSSWLNDEFELEEIEEIEEIEEKHKQAVEEKNMVKQS